MNNYLRKYEQTRRDVACVGIGLIFETVGRGRRGEKRLGWRGRGQPWDRPAVLVWRGSNGMARLPGQ